MDLVNVVDRVLVILETFIGENSKFLSGDVQIDPLNGTQLRQIFCASPSSPKKVQTVLGELPTTEYVQHPLEPYFGIVIAR